MYYYCYCLLRLSLPVELCSFGTWPLMEWSSDGIRGLSHGGASWLLCLVVGAAVSWDLSCGCQSARTLPVASPGGKGLFRFHQLGSKNKCPEREPSRSCVTFSSLASKVTQHHFDYLLFFFSFFWLFMAASEAYRGSHARGRLEL